LLWGPIVYIEDEELQALMTALTKCLDEYAQAQAFGDDTYTRLIQEVVLRQNNMSVS
jgi:hypothetical protein